MPKLSNKTAVIVGCARDIEKEVSHSMSEMYRLGNEFKKFALIVYENDSKDGTLKKLKSFSRKHTNVIILHEKNVRGHRTKRLAHGRNKLLQYARQNYGKYDFFIVMDMDFTRSNTTSLASVASSMKPKWDAVTAVSREYYYDWWAFRCKRLNMDYDCWGDRSDTLGDCIDWGTEWEVKMNNRLRKVESAFNGIAIYKFDRIPPEASYIGDINGKEVCEHVNFNKYISNIYIYPRLVTSTWDE